MHANARFQVSSSNDSNSVGNIESIIVRSQVNIGFLSSIRTNECVHLGTLYIVELADSLLDFGFCGIDVNKEDQGVDLLDLFHGRLSCDRALDDAILVELVTTTLHRLSRVLWVPSLGQGLGFVEAHLRTNLLYFSAHR